MTLTGNPSRKGAADILAPPVLLVSRWRASLISGNGSGLTVFQRLREPNRLLIQRSRHVTEGRSAQCVPHQALRCGRRRRDAPTYLPVEECLRRAAGDECGFPARLAPAP